MLQVHASNYSSEHLFKNQAGMYHSKCSLCKTLQEIPSQIKDSHDVEQTTNALVYWAVCSGTSVYPDLFNNSYFNNSEVASINLQWISNEGIGIISMRLALNIQP